MAPIPNVGKAFADAQSFLTYLNGIRFNSWRPRYVTAHHTGAPDLKTWRGWQTRKSPVSDVQWLKNLAAYYGNTMKWSAGPHFFFTPNHFCVLSPPTARGVHAVSFNSNSWGVEMVGNFDSEAWSGAVRDKYVEGLACLHLATGLALDPFVRGQSGLHFHRDDHKTSKTCPGKLIDKADLIARIKTKMSSLSGAAPKASGGDHPEEKVVVSPPAPQTQTGVVNTDGLNVRLDASQKAPAVRQLKKGTKITIYSHAMNGTTKWLRIGDGEWVSAHFVTL